MTQTITVGEPISLQTKLMNLSVVVVVYELSTAARQEAKQWSAEVDIIFFLAKHRGCTNKKNTHWCAQRNMGRSVKETKTYVKPVWEMVSKLDAQMGENCACPECQAWTSRGVASSQNMH